DYGPNGLQVEGRPTIRRLVTAVSSCRELFVRARRAEADAVLVHHGIFWNGMPVALTGMQYRRVRELVAGEINLLAYHLPLDRHPIYGNNALAARAFELVDVEPFAVCKGLPIGFKGSFAEPVSAADLRRRCAEIYGQEPLTFDDGPDPVETLGIVSGGAQQDFHTAIGEGLDAFVTGEVSEWVMNVAEESGTHFLAAGHYASERLGVRALGEHLGERFGITVEFIDLPNPV
ncbi:MAG: Nif3-like dinuclear metal center hexameric protein, partial [Thermoanaerobaculia bacterium]